MNLNTHSIDIMRTLIGFKSVTPLGLDCLQYISQFLYKLDFEVEIVNYGAVYNLFAIKKGVGPHICFAGHVDVVPPAKGWTSPYDLEEDGDHLIGLGTCDMKGAIACFLAALQKNIKNIDETISVLLTTDEEGDATDGLKKYIESDTIKNQNFDLFILGEPTCHKYAGDAVKIGRRGSVTAELIIEGIRGHIAYPEFTNSVINPIQDLINLLHNKQIEQTDSHKHFPPSKIQITGINVDRPVENVIPGILKITFGTRFNPNYTSDHIIDILSNNISEICKKYNMTHNLVWKKHGEPFIMNDSSIMSWLDANISSITKQKINFNADGATSDGRFLTKLAPVVEIGLEESQAHQKFEKTTRNNIDKLSQIFENLLLNLKTFPKSRKL